MVLSRYCRHLKLVNRYLMWIDRFLTWIDRNWQVSDVNWLFLMWIDRFLTWIDKFLTWIYKNQNLTKRDGCKSRRRRRKQLVRLQLSLQSKINRKWRIYIKTWYTTWQIRMFQILRHILGWNENFFFSRKRELTFSSSFFREKRYVYECPSKYVCLYVCLSC